MHRLLAMTTSLCGGFRAKRVGPARIQATQRWALVVGFFLFSGASILFGMIYSVLLLLFLPPSSPLGCLCKRPLATLGHHSSHSACHGQHSGHADSTIHIVLFALHTTRRVLVIVIRVPFPCSCSSNRLAHRIMLQVRMRLNSV
jgi:hypothetical protein